VVRTLRAEFSDVVAFPLFDARDSSNPSGNMVLLASNRRLDNALAVRDIPDVHRFAAAGVRAALAQGIRLPDYANGLMLTDDFNPLDVFDADLHEGVRKTILQTTPSSILLHG
jgi:hypothetical protein